MTEQEAHGEFQFTDAEWREYQAMPDQGYSHRGKLEFFVNRWHASRHPDACDRGEHDHPNGGCTPEQEEERNE